VDFQQLKTELATRFPKVWIKDGAEFDSRHANSLWTGEGSEIDVHGDQVYTVAAFDNYSDSVQYVFGVWRELHNFLHARGFYAEAYDGGTYFIYEA
jgi:hypothetical protein